MESYSIDEFKIVSTTILSDGENIIVFRQHILDGMSGLDNEDTDYQYFYIKGKM